MQRRRFVPFTDAVAAAACVGSCRPAAAQHSTAQPTEETHYDEEPRRRPWRGGRGGRSCHRRRHGGSGGAACDGAASCLRQI